MKWNSITEIPKPYIEVLLKIWEGDWNRPKQNVVKRTGLHLQDGKFMIDNNNYRVEEGEAYEITHWEYI